MTISQKTPVKSEIEGNGPLSEGTRAFLCARTRDNFFDYIHGKLSEAEAAGLKRSALASRIGKTPTRLSHLLGAPGNWTLDTITELLAGISGEEIIPQSASILRRKESNTSSDEILNHNCSFRYNYEITNKSSVNILDDADIRFISGQYIKTGSLELAESV